MTCISCIAYLLPFLAVETLTHIGLVLFFMVMNGYYCMSDTKVGNISLFCKYSLPKVYTECLSLLFPADIFFSLI